MATSKKVTELPTINAASNSDVLYIVHDPAGVPVSNKITVQNLLKDSTSVVLAANAYSNSVVAANSLAGNAYSNAVAAATSLAGNAYSNAISAASFLAGNAYTNAVAAAASLAGNAYTNAVAYVVNSTTMLSPNIAYTGVFNLYPPVLDIFKNQTVYFTGNNTVLETPGLYWLKRFEASEYDLSQATSLDFINIGGIDTFLMTGAGFGHDQITSLNFHDVVAVTNTFTLGGFTDLATCNSSSLIFANNITISGMQNAHTQFDFSGLKYVRNLYFTDNSVLEDAPQFPALQEISNEMSVANNSATNTTFTFTSLEKAKSIAIYTNSGMLSGPEFPQLTEAGEFIMYDNINVVNPPTIPSLTTVRGLFKFANHDSVTVAPDMSSIVTILGIIEMYENISMVNGIDLTSLKHAGGSAYFNGCALDQTTVDYILTKFASLDGTNGTTSFDDLEIDVSDGTNAVPGVAGLAAIDILEARGCIVYRNT